MIESLRGTTFTGKEFDTLIATTEPEWNRSLDFSCWFALQCSMSWHLLKQQCCLGFRQITELTRNCRAVSNDTLFALLDWIQAKPVDEFSLATLPCCTGDFLYSEHWNITRTNSKLSVWYTWVEAVSRSDSIYTLLVCKLSSSSSPVNPFETVIDRPHTHRCTKVVKSSACNRSSRMKHWVCMDNWSFCFQMANDARTEKEKMSAGELYDAYIPQLMGERDACKELVFDFNITRPSEGKKRDELLRKLFGSFGNNSIIETPLQCDYGYNVYWGNNSLANHNLVILDICPVHVGDYVLIGPDVKFYGGTHPADPQQRLDGQEYGKPIRIGNNVWIGGGAIIVAGVTIGDNSVIGAGSVVVKDIPANVVAVGNPCRVIKPLDPPTRPPKQFQQLTQFNWNQLKESWMSS